ncbi:MAG TPA: hypothetical protein DCK95_10120 [Anaerolineaceae bacterium]|nr:hypothetical protein [Anaerolineaceae bacterium]
MPFHPEHNLNQGLDARLRILERYPKMTILHHVDEDQRLWGTSGREIWVRSGQSWKYCAKFPFHSPRDIFGFSRATTRAFRADKCNIYGNRFGKILGIRAGTVYQLEDSCIPKPLFTINGDCVLHGSLCEDRQGNIYFGEYFMNSARQAVRIWRVAPRMDHWEIAYAFPAAGIRHVHGIYRDPYEEETFWVTVGDFSGECYILCTRDLFKTFTRYGDGKQTWRAVRVFFTEQYVCWITDSNLEQNYACRMSRSSGALEKGMQIANSSWYGTTTTEGLHVAFTTVEKGEGITSPYSQVLVSRDAFNWQVIYQFKKDFYRPVQVFKYGVISCPSGEMSQHDLYISGEGLVGLDGKSMRIDISELGEKKK